jgi:ABC-type lipoprotein export system ATPase subunit
MNDMTIAITGPSGSGKTNFFNLLAEKKEKPN